MTLDIDPFESALDDLRVAGSVLLHESYGPPWAVDVPEEARLRDVLKLDRSVRVFPFHLVLKKGYMLETAGSVPLAVDAPEVAICAGGLAHRMSRGKGACAVQFEDILSGAGPKPATAADADATQLVCGVFMTRALPFNPMLGALPAVLKISTSRSSETFTLSSAAELLAAELERGGRGGFTAHRLLEIFFAELIRAYRFGKGRETTGWFRGLDDPKICSALARVHGAPEQPWSVETMASSVALSPSRFAARFREATGDSVMGYVSKWRANVACQLLKDTELPLAEIAARVGYESVPAFSRAFKSLVGDSPASWRSKT